MKNRDYKKFTTGEIYHIYNRGNNRENIFHDKTDYKSFMFRVGSLLGLKPIELVENELSKTPCSRIRLTMKPGFFKLHSFCLMPNHFHLLIEQCGEISISNFMLRLSTSFSMYMNIKYKRVGHVFQDQFKSVLIGSNSQLMWTSSYIHMNPVKSKLVHDPSDYIWSSYKDFIDERYTNFLEKKLIKEIFGNIENLKKQTFVLGLDMSRAPLDTFTNR